MLNNTLTVHDYTGNNQSTYSVATTLMNNLLVPITILDFSDVFTSKENVRQMYEIDSQGRWSSPKHYNIIHLV